MTLDPARARFPECGECGNGVDENDPHTAYYIIDRIYYHAKCYQEAQAVTPKGASPKEN